MFLFMFIIDNISQFIKLISTAACKHRFYHFFTLCTLGFAPEL